MEDKSVYAGIYDIVSENLNMAGMAFEYRKSTFLCDVEAHPQDVCVTRFRHLSNPEFMEAVYVAALKRLPDERTVDFWAGKYDMPKEAFRKEVLRCIAASSVVAVNHVHLRENPYFEQEEGLRYKALGMLYGLTDKSSLRELGKKLPMPLQKIIRKIFL